jgi:hypothetical protein
MKEIRLKISDIFELEPQIPDQPRGLAAITGYVLKHYAFLPQPIAVTVEGDEVVISYPEEADTKREEAARLAARAVKRASEGQVKRAHTAEFARRRSNFFVSSITPQVVLAAALRGSPRSSRSAAEQVSA